MRILCLHGYGTSGSIMRDQLRAFMNQCDPSYEFVFLDGDCLPQDTGPTLTYNRSFGPSAIASSLEYIDGFIETDGPFDGIIGFSQGGSLALTYLLREAGAFDPFLLCSKTPPIKYSTTTVNTSSATSEDTYRASNPTSRGGQPSFKFAIFLSTIVAFSPTPRTCSALLTTFSSADKQVLRTFPFGISDHGYASLSPPIERGILFGALGRVLTVCLEGGFIEPHTDLGLGVLEAPLQTPANNAAKQCRECKAIKGDISERAAATTFSAKSTHELLSIEMSVNGTVDLDSCAPSIGSECETASFNSFPRLVHPGLLAPTIRVSIPTIHLVGAQDHPTLISMSRLMEGVCEPTLVKRIVHVGGHHPPLASKDVRALATAVEWAVRVAERGFC